MLSATNKAVAFLAAALVAIAAPADAFRFVILGDRTGEVQPGVYERVLRQAASENPAFIISVGDSIEGLNDAAAESEWQRWAQLLLPYKRFPLYLAAGNHDIWSPASEKLFRLYARHPPHYSLDYGTAHFTILDNSRSDEFSPDEMAFLEKDLQEHAAQPVKFILSHRPSWLIDAAFGNPNFALHQLARKYGVNHVIAGHIHQMLHVDLEGVSYVSMVSSGGHLRLSGRYEDGWFFGHALIEIHGREINFQVKESPSPDGHARITNLRDWGKLGLIPASQKMKIFPSSGK